MTEANAPPATNSMEISEASDDGAFLVPHFTLTREITLLLTVCSAQALVQACLAQGILPDLVIGQSFGVDEANGTWGPAAYALTSGKLTLMGGTVVVAY